MSGKSVNLLPRNPYRALPVEWVALCLQLPTFDQPIHQRPGHAENLGRLRDADVLTHAPSIPHNGNTESIVHTVDFPYTTVYNVDTLDTAGTGAAMEKIRQCAKCGQAKPIEAFPYSDKLRGYRHCNCRECRKGEASEWRNRNKEHVRSYRDEYYKQTVKPNHKAWYAAHREKAKASTADWRSRNLERSHQISNDSHERHREAIHAYDRARYEANREYFSEKNRRWMQAHPLQVREKSATRRARIAATTTDPVDYGQILDRQGWVCHLCGDFVTPETLSFDHVIPLSKGGPHSAKNIKVAHRACNSRKGNRA